MLESISLRSEDNLKDDSFVSSNRLSSGPKNIGSTRRSGNEVPEVESRTYSTRAEAQPSGAHRLIEPPV